MKRRQVLKNLGLGAGFLVVTPTIMNLLQSCTNEPEFIPLFITKGEGYALRRIVDLIIPNDDKVPGAVAVGVHSFIDSYWNSVIPVEQQGLVKVGFKVLADKFRSTFEKELEAGKPEEFDQLLSQYLKTTEEQQKAYGKKMEKFYEAYEKDPTTQPDADASIFSLLSNVRGMTIWAWKTSEQIGENVLWYDPVPGQQKGCIPLSEAGNGKVMAL
ncbi:MAG: gluconate 2-dehydrogenase subunit 3 family protein [Flavobacteriaceae bacterium]|nr:gluconate 2-dehydrogenase subunit 3 family protein [Flavobacteriaceae bacterium]